MRQAAAFSSVKNKAGAGHSHTGLRRV